MACFRWFMREGQPSSSSWVDVRCSKRWIPTCDDILAILGAREQFGKESVFESSYSTDLLTDKENNKAPRDGYATASPAHF